MKEIKIDIEKLARMPKADIDDKDLLSDSLLDSLFGYQSYDWERNEALGFIAGYPTYVNYSGSTVEVFFAFPYARAKGSVSAWKRQVVENLTEIENTDVERKYFDVLCEDRDLVYRFNVFERSLWIVFRHYDESLI